MSYKNLKVFGFVSAMALFSACGGQGSSAAQGSLQAGDVCGTSADCEAGLECELEHGERFCKPHGGDQDGDDDSSASPSPSPSPTGAAACASDADCPAGQECELEHGTSFCKPHGGNS